MTARLPLVARSAALAELDDVLAAAAGGRGCLLTLTGGAGVGKTRLAEEITVGSARPHRPAPFRTVWTRAGMAPGPALRPWSMLVRELAGERDAAAVIDGSAPLTTLLRRRPASAAPPADPVDERGLLGLDLRDLLDVASRRRPLLVVVDDLHDADATTIQLAVDLAGPVRSLPVVLLATIRSDANWSGREAEWLGLTRAARDIGIHGFDVADVTALIDAIVPGGAAHAGSAADAADLVRRTGGNPLMVCELLAHGADQASSIADLARGTGLPDAVRAVVAARLLAVSAGSRAQLTTMAVLGTEFRLDLAADVTGAALTATGTAVREGISVGLLRPAPAGRGRFEHDVMRDGVYQLAGTDELERLHARAGLVLLDYARRGRDAAASHAAHHLLLGGSDVVHEAAAAATAAGEQASAALAFEESVRWYHRAEQLLAGIDVDDARRAQAALAVGTARRIAGDRDAARADLLRAATHARRAARPDLLARAALAFGREAAGFEVDLADGEQIGLLREATDMLPPGSALRSQVSARLSVATALIETVAAREDLARSAITDAALAGDEAARAAALAALCDALAGPAQTRRRADLAGEIVQIGRRLPAPTLELLGRRLRVVALLEQGDMTAAQLEIEAFRVTAEALRHPLYLWYVPLWTAMRALLHGRFDEARTANLAAAEVGARVDSGNAGLLVLTQRWCLEVDSGNAAVAADLAGQFAAFGITGGWAAVALALMDAQAGRTAAAREHLTSAQPLLPDLPVDSEWLPCVAQVAETIAIVGGHPATSWAYSALLPHEDLWAVEGIGAALRGPVPQFLAVLAAALGDADASARHLRRARAMAARVGVRLRDLRVAGAAAAPPDPAPSMRREGEYWSIRFPGATGVHEIRLRASKGLADLAVLLAAPGRATAALDLVAAGAFRSRVSGTVGSPGGSAGTDAGEALDAAARAAYRQRLVDLEEQSEDADATGDLERSARIGAERDALLQALAGAYGLGGRARRLDSPAERARTAVTTRIRDAIRRIAVADPDLGEHLARTVRTGTFCAYDPRPPVRWTIAGPTTRSAVRDRAARRPT